MSNHRRGSQHCIGSGQRLWRTTQLCISQGELSSQPRIRYCISRIGDYEACIKDDNADGPESLIDMKTAKLSVVSHLHDNDRNRFSLIRLYSRYIVGTTSNLWT